MNDKHLKKYWKKNLIYLLILLSIWFVVSYGFGILFRKQMDHFSLGSFRLGFWFAQNGAIYVFIILIFAYVYLMNKLDKDFDVNE